MAYQRINVANLTTADVGKRVYFQTTFRTGDSEPGFYPKGRLIGWNPAGKVFIENGRNSEQLDSRGSFLKVQEKTDEKPDSN